jgi:hypothetical protein
MLNERDAQLDAEENGSGHWGCLQLDAMSAILSSWPALLTRYTWKETLSVEDITFQTPYRLCSGGGIMECQDDVPDAVREKLFLKE